MRLPAVPHAAEESPLLDNAPRPPTAVETTGERLHLLLQGHRQQQVKPWEGYGVGVRLAAVS